MEYKLLEFDIRQTTDKDSGVVHIYFKETQTYLGFFKFVISKTAMSQFMSDNKALDELGDKVQEATKEISTFRKDFIETKMLPSGFKLDASGTMAVKMEYIVDKGDGTPPIKKVA